MEMIVSAVEESPDRTSWSLEGLHDWKCNCCYKKKKKKKPHNPWKSQTINSCLKNCSGVVHAFSGFGTESAKKIMKETVDIAWKGGRGEESQNMDLGNIQELADPTAEELTE